MNISPMCNSSIFAGALLGLTLSGLTACIANNGTVSKGVAQINAITLYPDIPYRLKANLTMTVLSIVEEWVEPNRTSVMFITLRMQTPENDMQVHVTSEEPILNWMGYKFKYLGGWREEVRLQQIEID